MLRTPNGIRTRVTAVKGRRPRPLDDGGLDYLAGLNFGLYSLSFCDGND